MSSIKKAIFPVAGLGTRFLPATKASPKEMLPIVDKPLIQYAVEEAINAGLTELIFITSSNKRSLEDHFDSNYELEAKLEAAHRYEQLKVVQEILPAHVSCTYVRQKQALGLGHAILCAKHVIGNEPFAVLLADDLLENNDDFLLKTMIKHFEKDKASIVGVQSVPKEKVSSYGIVDIPRNWHEYGKISNIFEKPKPEEAPSNQAVVGRYILTPNIMQYLSEQNFGYSNEIQLTDAIASLITKEPVYACEFKGIRYDCGNKLGYLQATIAYALKHPELKKAFEDYLIEYMDTIPITTD